VIELAPGAALRGTQLFRLEMYGLVTAVAENVMRLDSVELYGAGSPAHADGLVLLEGCDVGRDRVFDKAVTITSLRPHPVEGQATVGYWSASGSRPRLVLRDAMGREALAVDLPPGEGSEREATVSTVNLPSGLYRLELRDRGEVSAVSVLVVH
jgi:hypothetical protein